MASFDIDALRAVVAGVEQGSFARAANELGRSQSAISMQLKKLEHQAGVPLFARKGRGLVPTEAGEALVQYARRIIALNDEAARAVGAAVMPETVRIGLPQDFYNDVMPAVVRAFSDTHPDVHITVRAGNNHRIGEDIDAGRLDAAIAFFPEGARRQGELLEPLPVRWLAHGGFAEPAPGAMLPLVLFNHPCLFRQGVLSSLDRAGVPCRAALTTPSLQAVWVALRAHFGIGARIAHALPEDIADVGHWERLPQLPPVELRLLVAPGASSMAQEISRVLRNTTRDALARRLSASFERSHP